VNGLTDMAAAATWLPNAPGLPPIAAVIAAGRYLSRGELDGILRDVAAAAARSWPSGAGKPTHSSNVRLTLGLRIPSARSFRSIE